MPELDDHELLAEFASGGSLQQRTETGLLKMPVAGQGFGDARLAHGRE